MKLGKISLAAVVAMGAFTTSAFAKDLSDAIKGVDVSGEIQWRYDNRIKDPGGTKEENHEFDASVMFKVPVSDSMTAVVDVIYSQDNDVYPEGYSFHSDNEVNASNISVDNLYFQYVTGKTTVMLGQMGIGAPFTDDMMMDGIKVLNQDVAGWTFAGVYANELEADGDSTAMALMDAEGRAMTVADLYTVAAIGSLGPVNTQLWYSHVTDGIDGLVWLQADAKFDPVKVDFVFSKTFVDEDLDIAQGHALGEDYISDATHYAIKLTGNVDPVKVCAGYTFAEVDDDAAASVVTIEGDGMLMGKDKLLRSEYMNKDSLLEGENSLWYLGVDGKVAGISLGLAYSSWDRKDSMEGSEITLTAKTKFAGLSIKPYYAMANIEPDGASSYDDQKFRVDVEYKF